MILFLNFVTIFVVCNSVGLIEPGSVFRDEPEVQDVRGWVLMDEP